MIVEGVFLPETLLKVADRTRIAVMVSSRAFHRQYFDHRYAWFAAYTDQAAAFHTVLDALDEMNRRWIAQAEQCQVPLFRIESPSEIGDVAAALATHFSLI